MALMVIGSTSLTEELYGKYIVGEYKKNYAVNIRNRFKSAARHIVVCNYKRNWGNSYSMPKPQPYSEAKNLQLRIFEAKEPYGKNK